MTAQTCAAFNWALVWRSVASEVFEILQCPCINNLDCIQYFMLVTFKGNLVWHPLKNHCQPLLNLGQQFPILPMQTSMQYVPGIYICTWKLNLLESTPSTVTCICTVFCLYIHLSVRLSFFPQIMNCYMKLYIQSKYMYYTCSHLYQKGIAQLYKHVMLW